MKRCFILPFCPRDAAVLFGKITIINRLHFASGTFLHVAALENPIAAQRRQARLDPAGESWVAPRTAAIIHAHRRVHLNLAVERFRRRQFDFAHRHAHAGVQLALDINPLAGGQLLAAVRFERIFGRDHNFCVENRQESRKGSIEADRHPYASITWIRFNGSAALPRRPLSLWP